MQLYELYLPVDGWLKKFSKKLTIEKNISSLGCMNYKFFLEKLKK
jgi:hypothetical protein